MPRVRLGAALVAVSELSTAWLGGTGSDAIWRTQWNAARTVLSQVDHEDIAAVGITTNARPP